MKELIFGICQIWHVNLECNCSAENDDTPNGGYTISSQTHILFWFASITRIIRYPQVNIFLKQLFRNHSFLLITSNLQKPWWNQWRFSTSGQGCWLPEAIPQDCAAPSPGRRYFGLVFGVNSTPLVVKRPRFRWCWRFFMTQTQPGDTGGREIIQPALIPGRYECGNCGVFRLVQTNPILHSLTRQRIGLSKIPKCLLGGWKSIEQLHVW